MARGSSAAVVSRSPPSSSSSTAAAAPSSKNRGLWSSDERIRFVNSASIRGWGKWSLISEDVGTRTPTQVKSHAQKVRRGRPELHESIVRAHERGDVLEFCVGEAEEGEEGAPPDESFGEGGGEDVTVRGGGGDRVVSARVKARAVSDAVISAAIAAASSSVDGAVVPKKPKKSKKGATSADDVAAAATSRTGDTTPKKAKSRRVAGDRGKSKSPPTKEATTAKKAARKKAATRGGGSKAPPRKKFLARQETRKSSARAAREGRRRRSEPAGGLVGKKGSSEGRRRSSLGDLPVVATSAARAASRRRGGGSPPPPSAREAEAPENSNGDYLRQISESPPYPYSVEGGTLEGFSPGDVPPLPLLPIDDSPPLESVGEITAAAGTTVTPFREKFAMTRSMSRQNHRAAPRAAFDLPVGLVSPPPSLAKDNGNDNGGGNTGDGNIVEASPSAPAMLGEMVIETSSSFDVAHAATAGGNGDMSVEGCDDMTLGDHSLHSIGEAMRELVAEGPDALASRDDEGKGPSTEGGARKLFEMEDALLDCVGDSKPPPAKFEFDPRFKLEVDDTRARAIDEFVDLNWSAFPLPPSPPPPRRRHFLEAETASSTSTPSRAHSPRTAGSHATVKALSNGGRDDDVGGVPSKARPDPRFTSEIRSYLASPPDFNNPREYVSSDDGLSRMSLEPGALCRSRIMDLLEEHQDRGWWKEAERDKADYRKWQLERLVALTVVMSEVDHWQTPRSGTVVGCAESCQFDDEDDILHMGQLLSSLWERVNRSLSQDGFALLDPAEGGADSDRIERHATIRQMVGRLSKIGRNKEDCVKVFAA